ncbi:MAG: glucoamylase family protein [Halieaceae bacterium]|jgi:cyclic beta-1,2-glucan synthetase|nr:glucoamylase family protein [Halieaceae bacterium]
MTLDVDYRSISASLADLDPIDLDRLAGIEWFLDNDYVIQQAIALVRDNTPDDAYRKLPVLAVTPHRSQLRALVLADELLNVCGTPLDIAWAGRFLRAYQQMEELSLGELWALPNLLRVIVLNRLAGTLRVMLDDLAKPGVALPDYSAAISGHVINLHTLASEAWGPFIESISLVHEILSRDPAGAYPAMDSPTRNHYRHQIETSARQTSRSEAEVARRVVALAQEHIDPSRDRVRREAHVGFYLLDTGRRVLLDDLKDKRPWASMIAAWGRERMPWWYLGAIAVVTAALLWPIAVYLRESAGLAMLIGSAPVALVLALTVAVSLIHWWVGISFRPHVLSKMDFSEGVPAEFSTVVVVPVLLVDDADIARLITRLEMNYLANPDPALHFALLSDYLDADALECPEDAHRLRLAVDGIEALNARHGRDEDGPFLLFHRPRRWNPAENCYMGWERKRGKLMEFNRLLLGDEDQRTALLVGEVEQLSRVRFVITLDADTQLVAGAAQAMISALAHPLNQPDVDHASGRVLKGYSIIQPRLSVDPEAVGQNVFTRAFAGDVVLDLYTHAVSDVYQDLFGVGIFAGKGIYDLRAFEETLRGRVPENAILSHDLFEGLHGRVGLATDIVLFEDYPDSAIAYARRSHRWTRGDWQLIPWLLPRVPTQDGRGRNRFTLVDRWKILDNLRRNLFAPAVLAGLVMAWTVLPGAAWAWTLGILVVTVTPIALGSVHALGSGIAQGRTLRALGEQLSWSMRREVLRWLFLLVLLPFEAYTALDAIVRTLWRLCVSRRHLLEWTAAAQSRLSAKGRSDAFYFLQQMAAAPGSAIVITVILAVTAPGVLFLAAPLLLAWLLAPLVALAATRRTWRNLETRSFTDEQRQTLRRFAVRSWQFFEHFVGPDNHWLPPDNYHEAPEIFVSRRTSPTNIGLMLVAAVSAYDLGYQGLSSMLPRLRHSYASLRRLERYRGHFYNWYRLDDLSALEPRYVSTVDSGNLAACLMVVARALQEILDAPLPIYKLRSGLVDMLCDLADTLRSMVRDDDMAPLQARLSAMAGEVQEVGRDRPWADLVRRFEREELPALQSQVLVILSARAAGKIATEEFTELRRSFNTLRAHLTACLHEIDLAPWLEWSAAATGDDGADEELSSLYARFRDIPGLRDVPRQCEVLAAELDGIEARQADLAAATGRGVDLASLLRGMRQQLAAARDQALRLIAIADDLARESELIVAQMDFAFLYDPKRHLLRLGYTATTGQDDPNYYDLLASEARLASFVAIAKGDVPPEHWLYLGRPFTLVGNKRSLVSWSATAFEYFMPRLLMREPPQSLLGESCQVAVEQQQQFAARFRVPWGISESAYYQLDKQAHYQYRAFGVPGLGLRVESDYRLVISPYSSALALPTAPLDALANLERLAALNMLRRYGFLEAMDFGPSASHRETRPRLVESYMSHHQGMILAALNNALNDDVLGRRFHSDPKVAVYEHLLYEQVPRGTAKPIGWRDPDPGKRTSPLPETLESWHVPAHLKSHNLKVLSNGHYQVMLNHSGMSSSYWEGLCLSRWQTDPCDIQGGCLYLKDLESELTWSAGVQPLPPSDIGDCEIHYSPHMAEYHRRDHGIHVTMAVTVAADDDVEIRRVVLTNDSDRPRSLLLVSYAEPVLAPERNHDRHPSFNKMFLDVSQLPTEGVLLARRRAREAGEQPIYLAHAVSEFSGYARRQIFFTDRKSFLGRGGSIKAPAALATGTLVQALGAENSLDPIMAVGIQLELPARAVAHLAFTCAVAHSRSNVVRSISAYRSAPRVDWAFERARRRSRGVLSDLRIAKGDVARVMALLSGVYALNPKLRATTLDRSESQAIQSVLWSRGISGDLPILLMHVRGFQDTRLAEELLRAHSYWDRQQVAVDLVLLDSEIGGYAQPTRTRLGRMVEEARTRRRHYVQGSVYIVPAAELTQDDRRCLLAAAWLIIDPEKGRMDEQLAALHQGRVELPPLVPIAFSPAIPEVTEGLHRPDDLLFDNGIGGFSADGREYVIFLEPGQTTPAPWSNVIANRDFGCLVTDSGAMCTWSGNSSEHRLTPWCNDPVRDPSGEAVFLRDEETGTVWSSTPQPMTDDLPYEIRHGAGYSRFRHRGEGLEQELTVFVDTRDPVKLLHLSLENLWQHPRRITVTYYVEWVLGQRRDSTRPYVVCEYDAGEQAVFARNSFSPQDSGIAFLAVSKKVHGFTMDRQEFLGLDGDPGRPAALSRIGLSDSGEANADPCAVLQVHVDIPAGARVELHFVLGEGRDAAHASKLVGRYRQDSERADSWARIRGLWDHLLGRLQVRTPDDGLNLMVNRWLLYQTVACRLWGRTALYQSGGGFGFRDQLQDVMALAGVEPALVREQILRAARVQFQDGDVLHWWHDNPLRGVRTRCSDDLLWLPYVTAHYVRSTGDLSILAEDIPYLDAPALAADEEERYAEYPSRSAPESLLDHCRRAMEQAFSLGEHGLPLIGSGDWNDGFSRMGIEGRGESVWLGWFQTVVCREFAWLADQAGDEASAQKYRDRADELVLATEAAAWDGDWYRRAYDDDGRSVGSAENDECSIELIAQTWSVQARAPDTVKAGRAMQSVRQYLMGDGIVRLLKPPFQHSESDPGYIMGYPPGVRENGAQYSHAATWAGWAFAMLGDGDRALEVFNCVAPVRHADSAAALATYQVEPYVVAADIYGVPPYLGRGGWTWYTGAAGWAYRLAVEMILGIRQSGQTLTISPCIPESWSGYHADLHIEGSHYAIDIERKGTGTPGLFLDGEFQGDGVIRLDSTGGAHTILLRMAD